MVVTLSGIITLVRALLLESIIPNGRNAVSDSHAGEGVVVESILPMVVTLSGIITLVRALLKKASSPMVVTLSGIITLVRALSTKATPNARNAVWNNHAGEGVVAESKPNGRNAVWNNHAGEGLLAKAYPQWS